MDKPVEDSQNVKPVRAKLPSGKSDLRKPNWIKMRPPSGEKYLNLKAMFKELNLATVCQEAQCPNVSECWAGGTATIMIMGDTCTRGCRFCDVKTAKAPTALDADEPRKVSYAVSQMGLDYLVITSVDRDDVEDQGAAHFAETISLLRFMDKNLTVEVLTPDFGADKSLIKKLVDAKPHVFAHNIETVEDLSPMVRDPRADYRQSLRVLKTVKDLDPQMFTKSSIMLGLGETDEQVMQALKDLRAVDCDVVTFGQYLQPRKRHLQVHEFVTPEKFEYWQKVSEDMGFLYVASGPLVRSSYKAGEFFMKGMIKKREMENAELTRKKELR
ncbi:MAG: lipoyl synthase [Bdellovibrionales bacterium]